MKDLIDRQVAIKAVGLNSWAGFRISKLPTVKAIPVEWIKKWCGAEPYWSNLAMHLIEDWEKENGR